jgi:hypothetical protein
MSESQEEDSDQDLGGDSTDADLVGEFDVAEAERRQGIVFVPNYDTHATGEKTREMLQITLDSSLYDATKSECSFGSIIIKNRILHDVLEMYVRVTEKHVKPQCTRDDITHMSFAQRNAVYNPRVIIRTWRGQNDCSGKFAITIFIRGGRKTRDLGNEFESRYKGLAFGNKPENIGYKSLDSLLRNYGNYCYGQKVGNTTVKLKFCELFSHKSTAAKLSTKKYKLDGNDETDPESPRSYVPDGDWVLTQNKYYFWECIRDTTLPWIGNNLLEHSANKLMEKAANALRTTIPVDLRTIASIAEREDGHWKPWLTIEEAKRKKEEDEEKARVEDTSGGLTTEETAGQENGKKKKRKASENPNAHVREEEMYRKSMQAKHTESTKRVWKLNPRALKYFQSLNGPIEVITDSVKLLTREAADDGQVISDDDLDNMFNDAFANPAVQERLPNAILGALNQMREPKTSHRYPFLLHWGGCVDVTSEVRKGLQDMFSGIQGTGNCTAMAIQLNTQRLTVTDFGGFSCHSIYQGPASAGKSFTVDILRRMSVTGSIVCHAINPSDRSAAVTNNPTDFSLQIYADTGETLTKDPKLLNTKQQEYVTALQILLSEQKSDYTLFSSTAVEKGGDAFLSREQVHIETWQRGPVAFISNRRLGKAEMRARVQDFQIGIATTRAMNMMEAVVRGCIDKSLSSDMGKTDVSTEAILLEHEAEGKDYQSFAIMNGLYRHIVDNDRYYTMGADILVLKIINWLAEEYPGMSSSVRNPRRMGSCLKVVHSYAAMRAYALEHWLVGGKYKFDPKTRECFYVNDIAKYLRDLSQQQIGSYHEAIQAVATFLQDFCDETLACAIKTLQRECLNLEGYNLKTLDGLASACELLHGPGSNGFNAVQFKKEKAPMPQHTASARTGFGAQPQTTGSYINPNYIEFRTSLNPEALCKFLAARSGNGMELSWDAILQRLFFDESGKQVKDWGVDGISGARDIQDGADPALLENSGKVLLPINILTTAGGVKTKSGFLESFAEDTAAPQITRLAYHKIKDENGPDLFVYTAATAIFDGGKQKKSPSMALKHVVETKLPYINQAFTGDEEIDAERIRIFIEMNHPEVTNPAAKGELAEGYRRTGLPLRGYFLDYTDHVVPVEYCITPTEESPRDLEFTNPMYCGDDDGKLILGVIEDEHIRNAYNSYSVTSEAGYANGVTDGFQMISEHLRNNRRIKVGMDMSMLSWWPLARRYKWTREQWRDNLMREMRAMRDTWKRYPQYYKKYMGVMAKEEQRLVRLREFARRLNLDPGQAVTEWLKKIIKKLAVKTEVDIATLANKIYPSNDSDIDDDGNLAETHPSMVFTRSVLSYSREPARADNTTKRLLNCTAIGQITIDGMSENLRVIVSAIEISPDFGGGILLPGDIADDTVHSMRLKQATVDFNKERKRRENEDDDTFEDRMAGDEQSRTVLKAAPRQSIMDARAVYVNPYSTTRMSAGAESIFRTRPNSQPRRVDDARVRRELPVDFELVSDDI